jgi:hypothetical protein
MPFVCFGGLRVLAGKRWESPCQQAVGMLCVFVGVGAAGDGQSGAELFSPSVSFMGRREGYVFKMGIKGLGYYVDAPDIDERLRGKPAATAAAATNAVAAAPSSMMPPPARHVPLEA